MSRRGPDAPGRRLTACAGPRKEGFAAARAGGSTTIASSVNHNRRRSQMQADSRPECGVESDTLQSIVGESHERGGLRANGHDVFHFGVKRAHEIGMTSSGRRLLPKTHRKKGRGPSWKKSASSGPA